MAVYCKYILPAILLSFLYPRQLGAQDKPALSARHTVYLEVLGSGGYGSLNYEHIIPLEDKLGIQIRGGISTYRLRDFELKFNPDIIIPVSAGIIYGKRHSFEIGIGQTFSSVSEIDIEKFAPRRKSRLSALGVIGYRITFPGPAIMLRLAYTPIWEFYDNLKHWAGLSFGYNF